MDEGRYELYQEEELKRYEAVCRRCGECCGSRDEDPCVNLAKDMDSGKYYCRSYETRIGLQKTVSGKMFHCIPIRDISRTSLLRPACAYNNFK